MATQATAAAAPYTEAHELRMDEAAVSTALAGPASLKVFAALGPAGRFRRGGAVCCKPPTPLGKGGGKATVGASAKAFAGLGINAAKEARVDAACVAGGRESGRVATPEDGPYATLGVAAGGSLGVA